MIVVIVLLRQHGASGDDVRQWEGAIVFGAAAARALGVRPCASIYKFIDRCPPHEYQIASLPDAVRAALYNLGPNGLVPGHQIAFYAFQHGNLDAISFASGLPWIDLYLADHMRGWRERCGLLRAVLVYRKIITR